MESALVKPNEKDEELMLQLFCRRNIGSLQKLSKSIAELFEQFMHRTDLIAEDGKSEHGKQLIMLSSLESRNLMSYSARTE